MYEIIYRLTIPFNEVSKACSMGFIFGFNVFSYADIYKDHLKNPLISFDPESFVLCVYGKVSCRNSYTLTHVLSLWMGIVLNQ